jgi:hypothetical protein
MTKDEMQAQLDELRAEIALLSAERAEQSNKESEENEDDGADAPSRVRELLSRFEDELDELPTLSSLGVFAMGVLLGRFLR